ncbi:MFS transporter [Bacillus sp. JCM 19041]|uniref:MFS transporter n=1 Tax=Bacillus sp. JCM 19041 TaxID=1460637 RepID=UPI000AB2B6FD
MNQSLLTWQLVVLYVGSVLYYGVHFPTILAFVQEIFERGAHNRLNGILEVQSQAASMIAGGVAGILFQLIDPARVLLFVALSSLVSFALISMLSYKPRPRIAKRTVKAEGTFIGVHFIKRNVRVCLSIFVLTIPFLTLMIGNYLRPIFINSTLQADASIYGFTNMLYSLGAVAAGVLIPIMYARYGAWVAAVSSVALYTISLLLVAAIPVIGLFLMMQILHGVGNAGSRICKQNIMMAVIPNAYMGRVNGIFEAVGTGIRLLLLLLFTYSLDWIGVPFAFLITGFISLMGLLFLLRGRKVLMLETGGREEPISLKVKSS